jgi:large subunit ribosomal protein L6
MSRVAKNPVVVPKGTEVQMQDQKITIKGPQGQLEHDSHPEVVVKREGDTLTFAPRNYSKTAKALAGTTRAIINNMVVGASKGFEKKLTIEGVGYRAQVQGKVINLTLGFSHPVSFNIPDGLNIETPTQTEILIKGVNKQQVGQVAADIRAIRPPESYKGKGVRYTNEVILLKETKKK